MIGQKEITLSSILDCVYCKRRYYLRNVEHQENINVYIELGKEEHEEVDKSSIKYDSGKYIVTNMAVYSDKYNMYGICDEVIFEESFDEAYIEFLGINADLYPVEFKHGKVRHCNEYIAQVVAQAICLEEMYQCNIKKGSIYFVDANEYYDFDISEALRGMVYEAIDYIQNYNGLPVKPTYSKKCRGCAMYDVCAPKQQNIQEYIEGLWK